MSQQARQRARPLLISKLLCLTEGVQQASTGLMPRPKLHRAICDCLDCTTIPTSVSAGSLAARQEPPPKCLVIYTDHDCPLGEDETAATPLFEYENVPHLDRLAKAGSCGVVSYREAPPGMLGS